MNWSVAQRINRRYCSCPRAGGGGQPPGPQQTLDVSARSELLSVIVSCKIPLVSLFNHSQTQEISIGLFTLSSRLMTVQGGVQ
jgi:hypothetical protein